MPRLNHQLLILYKLLRAVLKTPDISKSFQDDIRATTRNPDRQYKH